MNQGIRELQPHDLSAALEQILLPRLVGLLRQRAPGHCMRLSDLDPDLMTLLCGRLRAEVPNAEIVILGNEGQTTTPPAYTVTSTKLVELRNPLPDGTQRPPLLVFIPTDLRAAAEDSFGVATFEAIPVDDLYHLLRQRLIEELPAAYRGIVVELLRPLEDPSEPWPFADPLSIVRFLLTAKINDNDAEAIGAALYELGLVPDFELLLQPERAPLRIKRNRASVKKLTWSDKTERGRVLDLELTDPAMRTQLGNFLTTTGVEEPHTWTRRLVFDRTCWPLAFHRWQFADGDKAPDVLCISEVATDLPTTTGDEEDVRLEQLFGQQYLPLGKQGLRKFNATFRVDPAPEKVEGLAKFTIQVISQEHGAVGLLRSKTAWKGNRFTTTINFTNLHKIDWEEGWHFIRVLAYTDAGDLMPLVDEAGKPIPWTSDADNGLRRLHESEPFYVLPEGEVDIAPPQRAVQREPSLNHAQLNLQFTALLDGRSPTAIRPTSVSWAEGKPRTKIVGADLLELKFGREGAINVPVAHPLRALETAILADAAGPITWRMAVTLDHVGTPLPQASQWPQGELVDAFLAARTAYFAAVRGPSHDLVSQGADFRTLRPLIVHYADTYVQLLQALTYQSASANAALSRQALADVGVLLTLDTAALSIADHRGQYRVAALLAPTHPLRALWLATWAEVGQRWLYAAQENPAEYAGPTRHALLHLLTPVGFPPILPMDAGRLFTIVDNLHPFWSLYSPAQEENPRGLVGEVCGAFGLPEPAIGGAAIDGAYLALRVQRYLLQHPYVRTLVINAFNAGRAGVLADMLLELQKQPAFANIRYDLRLFVPDPDAPNVGEALATLLAPTANVTVREAGAFSTPTGSHLHPKLALAIRPTREFRDNPAHHAAHLTFLFDLFPAEEIGVAPIATPARSPIHGLVQSFHVDYQEDRNTVAWRRQAEYSLASPLPDAEELTDLLSSLAVLMASATATVATSQPGPDLRPVVTLALTAEDRALLHQVHEVSDWVLTLDRNMGIEFFDHRASTARPDYLIDHSPDMVSELGHRLFITSRSLTELETMVRPMLTEHGIQKAEGRYALTILNQLRSLSGRLAFKLISSSAQRTEALGLALARLYLEHQDVFANQIVVPLDAHIDLYSVLKQGESIGNEISFKRTDLALFDLNAGTRTITCRLVEVKCYNSLGDLGAFKRLQAEIATQIEQSQTVLRWHFDPQRNETDRPDRLIKAHELALLLEFYLDHAIRYGIVAAAVAAEARFFLYTLENGYKLAFTRSALIFDLAKAGTEAAEQERNIEYHRIGIDLIRQLVEAAALIETESTTFTVAEADPTQIYNQSQADLQRRRDMATAVPALASAAFLSPPRDHTVAWEAWEVKRKTAQTNDASAWMDALLDDAADEKSGAEEPPPFPAPNSPDEEGDNVGIPIAGEKQPETPVDPPINKEGRSKPVLVLRESSEVIYDPTVPAELSASPLEESGVTENSAGSAPAYDIMLGVTSPSPQYGLLAELAGRKLAIDLNQTHTISLFGVQGGGKSYTLGTIAEMASMPIPQINCLPRPLATVIFHYSPTMDYAPEFTSMVAANTDAAQLQALRERYGAAPQSLADVIMLVPEDKLAERTAEYPGIAVHPLKFAAAELQASHWRFLMGAVGNQATYIRQLNRLMKSLRNNLTLATLRAGIEDAGLPTNLKDLATMRLDLAAEYIDDSVNLSALIRPGRLIIVDLRDEFIEKDEALGLFVVLLQLFADAKADGEPFNKLVVFDEAHKYIESPDLVAGLIEVVREMRHKGTSILVASQDPPSVPVSLIELSSQIILHKFNSPAWLKHIQKANAALSSLNAEKMANLRPGEAFIWSSKATDDLFSREAVRVRCRPRVTQHGGDTKTAL